MENPYGDLGTAPQYFTAKTANVKGMNEQFMGAFGDMAQEYYAQTGKPLVVNDAFRTHEAQAEGYRRKPNLVAPPGHSLHEKGMAMDIDETQANELDKMGLFEKHGFYRPMMGQGGGKNEPWHIQMVDATRRAEAIAAKENPYADLGQAVSPATASMKNPYGDLGTASAEPPAASLAKPTEAGPKKAWWEKAGMTPEEAVMSTIPEAAMVEQMPDPRKFPAWIKEGMADWIMKSAAATDPASFMSGMGINPPPESATWQVPQSKAERRQFVNQALEPSLLPEGRIEPKGAVETVTKAALTSLPDLMALWATSGYAGPFAGAPLGTGLTFGMYGAATTPEDPGKAFVHGATAGTMLGLVHKAAGALVDPVAKWTARVVGAGAVGYGAGGPENAALFAMFEVFGMPRDKMPKDISKPIEKAIETGTVTPESIEAVQKFYQGMIPPHERLLPEYVPDFTLRGEPHPETRLRKPGYVTRPQDYYQAVEEKPEVTGRVPPERGVVPKPKEIIEQKLGEKIPPKVTVPEQAPVTQPPPRPCEGAVGKYTKTYRSQIPPLWNCRGPRPSCL